MKADGNNVAAFLKEKLLYSIQSINEIGEELSAIEEFESSSRAVLHLIMGTLVISKAAILLFDEERGELTVSAGRGLTDSDLAVKLSRDVVKALSITAGPVLVSRPENAELVKFFKKNEEVIKALSSHIWVPLWVKRGFLGVISVSKKFMDQEYEQVDLELLNIIARQLSIAVNNFRLIRSLKEANFQLNRKILELETLYDLGIAIGSLMEIQELSEQILINAVGLTDASAGLLALKADSALDVQASINVPADDLATLRDYGEIQTLIESGEPWLDNDADSESSPFGFRKFLFVPLRGQHEVQGLIGLGDKESRIGGLLDFGDEDQRLLINFASQAGVALENAKFYAESVEKERLERELQVAASIQQNLLPKSPPAIPGFEIAATTVPSRMVGGDHYDFIPGDGEYLISIADVSGKGIPAALLVSTLHATLRAHTESAWDLEQIVHRISRSIYASSLSNKFITFFLARLEPEKLLLSSVNAGHNYPMIVSAEGEIKHLRSGGLCLGLLQESEYEEEQTRLQAGDAVVFYTDGVTEAFNPEDEEFSEMRLESVLLANRHRPAQEIFDTVLNEVRSFAAGAPQHDDLTLIVIKVAPRSASSRLPA